MAYGSLLADTVQGSTASTPPVFKDGNGTEIGTLCRAWVRFNGAGTVAINASFNVSSITDNGTGDYTVNFTTAMSDANYAVTGTASGSGYNGFVAPYPSVAPTTTGVRVATQIYSNALTDQNTCSVAIFR